MLKKIVIENYLIESNTSHKFFLSYELFGRIIASNLWKKFHLK